MLRFFNLRYGIPIAAVLAFLLAIIWARNDDPFERLEFSLRNASGEKVEGIVILPKPAAKYPVVIYAHAHGEDLLTMGTTLRRFAELGLATVGFEYDQTNQAAFNEQFLALQTYISRQKWAQSNAIAWVGFSQGAQETLRFVLTHPEIQPQLLVRLSGGWVSELDFKSNSLVSIHCPILLVNGENDEVFPAEDAKRLAILLRTNGTLVNLRILTGQNHAFGDDLGVVMRMVAEYCRANLPLADYTATLGGCKLNQAERERFNLSMQRAGQHRRELWKAVVFSREPERRTVMMVIGGLEDYDLAHITTVHLKEVVHIAWQARRKFFWCRNTPLDIFESVTANPRFYEEPIENFQPYFAHRLYREVKYCHTMQEVSDTIWRWMHARVLWDGGASGKGKTPREILDNTPTDCLGYVVLYSALCRSVGLAERPTKIVWQNSLDEHFCTEVWSVEDNRWHELDSSADNRTYNTAWILRVPKAMILAPTGERGNWNALAEGNLDAVTNTIGLVYPSGKVAIKVLNQGVPVPDETIGIQLPTVKGLVLIARVHTNSTGKAYLTLGESAKYPYRVFVDMPGASPWQWLEVHTNQTYDVVLNLEDKHPFDPETTPPALAGQIH